MLKDIISTTREFCRDIINMKKLWTRAEIDALKNEDGTSAWRFRGGFYHNPKTDETTPFCRHFWEAVTVKERRNK